MSNHPHFQHMLSSPHHNQYGYITLGNEKVHRIGDVHEFYKALGYNDEISKTGLMPEEYVWEQYHKDKSEKSECCLQDKIIEYLSKHSPSFKKNYAVECEHWLANCMGKWTNKSTDCIKARKEQGDSACKINPSCSSQTEEGQQKEINSVDGLLEAKN